MKGGALSHQVHTGLRGNYLLVCKASMMVMDGFDDGWILYDGITIVIRLAPEALLLPVEPLY